MRRSNDMTGKTIVTSESGEQLGKAADLLVSKDGHRIVGVVVSSGMLNSEKGVLPFHDVRSLGGDVIVANGREPLLDHEGWQAQRVETVRSSHLLHKRVVTTDGRDVGRLSELCIDEGSGTITGFEIAEPAFAGLVQHRRVIDASGEIVIGKDLVLVTSVTDLSNDSHPKPDHTRGRAAVRNTHPVTGPGTPIGNPIPGQPIEPRR